MRFGEQRRDRMRHRDMRDAAIAEERGLPAESAIDELIDQHEEAGIEMSDLNEPHAETETSR